ncbi:MAG: ferredoxin reductase [Nocardiaceae bacterium]|nr:ferredoxin reductase [Nocardiaceae bacterium]
MTTTLGPLPTDRLRRWAARIGESIATPLVPSDYLDLIDPLRTSAKLRGRIVEIRPETRDAVTVVITPGRTWKGHIPGQYVRIGVDVDGVRLWRTYSLTSETTTRDISITVKAIDGGKVSNYLVRRATAGTVVQLEQAAGDFTVNERPDKALFVTAGSGITPVMGMLRNHQLDDVVVIHSSPTKSDAIFGGELRMLARHGKIRLIERHTSTDGRLTPDALADLVPDYTDRETWACGPGEFLDALGRALARRQPSAHRAIPHEHRRHRRRWRGHLRKIRQDRRGRGQPIAARRRRRRGSHHAVRLPDRYLPRMRGAAS